MRYLKRRLAVVYVCEVNIVVAGLLEIVNKVN